MAAEFALQRRLIIRASAGSGKTFQLALRFVRLLAQGHACEEILATTFTRKAAGEILGRVLTLLADGALGLGHDAQMREFARQTGANQDDCRRLLAQMASQLHRVRVCTLDSFFSQIARTHSLELGLPPSWAIVDELRDAQLRRRAIESMLRDEDSSNLIRLMSLITKGDAARGVAQLMLDTVNRLYQLYLDADSSAWTAVEELPLLDQAQWEEALRKFDQVALPHQKRIRDSIAQGLAHLENEQWTEFLDKGVPAKLLASDGQATYYGWTVTDELRDAMQPLMRQAVAQILRQYRQQTAATYELLHLFHQRYEQLKHRERAHRFEDVTRYLGRLGDAGGVEGVSLRLDGRIEQLMVDEFQDTSPAQWRVLTPFAAHAAAVEGRSFFCVGDVKQAIYGWRGGDARLFDSVEQGIDGMEVRTLNESFRSSRAVIRAVNAIFDPGPAWAAEHPAIQQWRKAFCEHRTNIDREGYVVLQAVDVPKQAARGASASTVEMGSEDAEKARKAEREEIVFARAARDVAALAERRPDLSIGVLVRKNNAVARIVGLLRELGVHASEEGGVPLTDSAGVLAALAALQLSDHPDDTVARFHVSQTPLGELLNVKDERDALGAWRAARHLRRRLLRDGYGPTILYLAQTLMPQCGDRERHRLNQLVELAYGYEEQSTLRPARFIRFVEHSKRDDPSAANVRVMTIHQSKGLEFEAVFLPQTEVDMQGQTPTCIEGREDPSEPARLVFRYVRKAVLPLMPAAVQEAMEQTKLRMINEWLCMLYVAVTRARTALYMYATTATSVKENWAGFLCGALHHGPLDDASRPLYVDGDPDWWRSDQADEVGLPNPVSEDDEQERLQPIVLGEPRPGESRTLAREAPSDKHGLTLKLSAWLRQLGKRVARRQGDVMHRWMEQVRWIEDGVPGEQQLRQAALDFADLEGQIGRLLRHFEEMTARPAVRRLLSLDTYAKQPGAIFEGELAEIASRVDRWEVRREQTFALIREGRMLHGQIDRLVLGWCGQQAVLADVIDYKTDAAADSEAALERHAAQLNDYCWAVQQIYSLPPHHVVARLLLLRSGEVQVYSPQPQAS